MLFINAVGVTYAENEDVLWGLMAGTTSFR